jgi:hypothetical protein
MNYGLYFAQSEVKQTLATVSVSYTLVLVSRYRACMHADSIVIVSKIFVSVLIISNLNLKVFLWALNKLWSLATGCEFYIL